MPSPNSMLEETHHLRDRPLVSCTDAETPLSLMHADSPCIVLHTSNLSAIPLLHKTYSADVLSPFQVSEVTSLSDLDPTPNLIDGINFLPREEISPASSTSGESSPNDDAGVSDFRHCSLDMFFATGSRVVRLFNLPRFVSSFLSAFFAQQRAWQLPIPISLWELRPDYAGPRHVVWAVYKSHAEACTALSLSGSLMSVVPALETDLEPFHKLRLVDLLTPVPALPPSPTFFPPFTKTTRMTPSVSDLRGVARSGLESDTLQRADFAISSNPPNPRTSFRLGDWICSSPICAAHNFGRNVVCIGCGCPRSADGPPSPRIAQPSTRPLASPRFSTLSSGTPSETPFLCPAPVLNHPIGPHFQKSPKPAVLSHPSLTPSGRAFSTTGKVQNISSDPLNPCVMYWPDNEPLPDQGQIRPCGLVGIPQPPILNTGNRGPIEHQPGDWICLKCSYLNWRRRKVCQTCYPYAEGNGDSISAAVQAERIALLTSVLAQSRITPKLSPSPTSSDSCDARARALSSSENLRSFSESSLNESRTSNTSQSSFDVTTDYMNSRPIYQTSGYRQSSISFSKTTGHHLHAPVPLLPSFLQDIIESPSLSPVSSSSADFSCNNEYSSSPGRSYNSRSLGEIKSQAHLSSNNIWRLDGEESKNFFATASHRQDFLGGNQKIRCENF